MFQVLTVILLPLAAGFFSFHSAVQGPNFFPVLSAFIAAPVITALFVMTAPEKYSRWITLLASSFLLGLGLKLFFSYQTAVSGFQFVEDVPWVNNLGINYSLGVDGMGTLMVLSVAIAYFAGALVSWNVSLRKKEYFILFSLLAVGIFGAYESLNLFFFFLFYEFAILPMYLLVGIWGTGERKEYAAMKMTIYLLAGSAFMFVGFLAVYFASNVHTFDIRTLSDLSATGLSLGFQNAWFLFVGFGVLSALFPIHIWSPDGYGSAPTAASMLHAGVLKNLGGYSLLRIALPLMPDGAKHWLPYLAVLALFNMLYMAIVALKQTNFKHVIAYSSISHCGAILFGICTLEVTGLNGAVIQLFSHGIIAAITFAVVGLVCEKAHTSELSKLGGFAACMPVLAGLFMAVAMANVGLPGLSGFVGEFLVFLGSYQSGFHGGFTIYQILFPIGILSIVLTAVYYLRLLQIVFFEKVKNPQLKEGVKDGSFIEVLPIAVLLITSLIIGLYPKPFVDMSNLTIAPLIDHIGGFK